MATIPLWLLGRHLAALSITGQAVSAGGVLSDSGSAVNLLAKSSGIDHSITPTKAEINSLNSTRENNVILSDGYSLNLSVLMVNDGTDPSPLRTLVESFDVLKVVITKGTGGSAKTYTGYFTRGVYSESMQGRGQVIASLALDGVDAGASSLVVS